MPNYKRILDYTNIPTINSLNTWIFLFVISLKESLVKVTGFIRVAKDVDVGTGLLDCDKRPKLGLTSITTLGFCKAYILVSPTFKHYNCRGH